MISARVKFLLCLINAVRDDVERNIIRGPAVLAHGRGLRTPLFHSAVSGSLEISRGGRGILGGADPCRLAFLLPPRAGSPAHRWLPPQHAAARAQHLETLECAIAVPFKEEMTVW